MAARGLEVVSDTGALTAAVDEAIAANPDVAAKIRDGKVAAAGVLVGAVMKSTKGQADAKTVRDLILSRLSYERRRLHRMRVSLAPAASQATGRRLVR